MTRGGSVLAVLVVFVLGLVAGALASHLFYAHSLEERGWRPGPPRRPDLVSRLDEQLGLSPEQRAEIERIMAESHAAAAELRRELGPRVREHVRASHDAILQVLTEEQRPGFEAMMERLEHRAERFFLGPPGDGRRGFGRRHRNRRPPDDG